MREPADIQVSFPRPGRTMKAVLIAFAAAAILGAVVVNWMPGGERGWELYSWLRFDPAAFLGARGFPRFWTLVTSGLLTAPNSVGHAVFALIGLYFLTPDLEKRWGGGRLLRFLALGAAFGNLAVLLGLFVHLSPGLGVGPAAIISATAIAWSKENAHQQVRLMFVLPVTGRALYWLTIGVSLLYLLFAETHAEGTAAPLGGVIAGVLFGGSPSPARSLWLRVKLALLRRKGGGLTVEQLLDDDFRSRPRAQPKKTGRKAPPLRVVQGGLEDDLKNRKPPKDKRYLN